MWRRKLGLSSAWKDGTGALHNRVTMLMQSVDVDYCIFYRELSNYPHLLENRAFLNLTDRELLTPLLSAFFDSNVSDAVLAKWAEWLRDWLKQLSIENTNLAATSTSMKRTNPKYIPREWMLVEAYEAAYNNDFEPLHTLEKLFALPYDEQPEFHSRFYKLSNLSALLNQPGTAFMSCSS